MLAIKFLSRLALQATEYSHNPHRPPLLHKRMKLYAMEEEHHTVLMKAHEMEQSEKKKKGKKGSPKR